MSRFSRISPLLTALLMAMVLTAPSAEAQILSRVKNAARRGAERAAEREAENRADRAVTRAADKAEATLSGGSASSPAATSPVSTASASPLPPAAEPAQPGDLVLVNYDFVPGDRILFAEDLETETVGDFPTRLTFKSGTYEVAEWKDRRWLRAAAFGEFAIDLPETLPERFTLEFDAAVPSGWVQEIRFDEYPTNFARFGAEDGGLERAASSGVRALAQPSALPGKNTVFPVKMMVDKGYVKVYMNGTRVANVPNAELGRSRTITFKVSASQSDPAYFGAFRLAEGGRALKAVQEAIAVAEPEAPLVLTGVVFDTGSARLRNESGPTLDAVAASLNDHPDVRVRVEGHTDNTGLADANQALSQARAEAVVAALATRGVAADRMTAQGLGATQPAVSNDTPEGRQQNRRVVLVRL